MFTQFPGAAATVYGVLGALKSLLRGAVSGHLGAGQLVLVAHGASGPSTAASTSGPSARTLLARYYGKKRSQP